MRPPSRLWRLDPLAEGAGTRWATVAAVCLLIAATLALAAVYTKGHTMQRPDPTAVADGRILLATPDGLHPATLIDGPAEAALVAAALTLEDAR
jgi:hypothetical protein